MSGYGMRHHHSSGARVGRALLTTALVLATATTARAQGAVAVAGRVAITERPGESTTDFASTIIYLVPKDSARLRTRPVPATITMTGRAFAPHVRVVTPGSRVEFPNQDPFSHNIFSSTPGQVFDLGLYGSGRSKDAVFRRAGAYPVYCNIHPRMVSFVVVSPSPWYAQAGNDGRWSIEGVPAGEYVLTVWHERAPVATQPVTVPATGVFDVATTLDARGYRFQEHKNKFGREYERTATRY